MHINTLMHTIIENCVFIKVSSKLNIRVTIAIDSLSTHANVPK